MSALSFTPAHNPTDKWCLVCWMTDWSQQLLQFLLPFHWQTEKDQWTKETTQSNKSSKQMSRVSPRKLVKPSDRVAHRWPSMFLCRGLVQASNWLMAGTYTVGDSFINRVVEFRRCNLTQSCIRSTLIVVWNLETFTTWSYYKTQQHQTTKIHWKHENDIKWFCPSINATKILKAGES